VAATSVCYWLTAGGTGTLWRIGSWRHQMLPIQRTVTDWPSSLARWKSLYPEAELTSVGAAHPAMNRANGPGILRPRRGRDPTFPSMLMSWPPAVCTPQLRPSRRRAVARAAGLTYPSGLQASSNFQALNWQGQTGAPLRVCGQFSPDYLQRL